MTSLRFTFLMIMVSCVLLGQEPNQKPLSASNVVSKSNYDFFSYANLGFGEEHSYFSIINQLNPKTYAELQLFYDTYTFSNRLRAELQLKRYLTQKMYIFSGLQIEAETRVGPGKTILPPRIGVTTGLGYDVNENFLLEAKGNFQLNKSPLGVFGERQIPMPKVYTVSGKLKF